MDGEILSEDEHQTSVDGSTAGYHAVARELLLLHSEIVTAVLLEHIIFFKRTFVKQHLNAFAGGILAAVMLLLNGFLTTTETSLFALLDKLLNFF